MHTRASVSIDVQFIPCITTTSIGPQGILAIILATSINAQFTLILVYWYCVSTIKSIYWDKLLTHASESINSKGVATVTRTVEGANCIRTVVFTRMRSFIAFMDILTQGVYNYIIDNNYSQSPLQLLPSSFNIYPEGQSHVYDPTVLTQICSQELVAFELHSSISVQ